VTDRCIPLVTAAYGTRVARPARTTLLPPGGAGFQLAQTVRPVAGDPPPRGQGPGGLAAAEGNSNSDSPRSSTRGRSSGGPLSCGSSEPAVTARAHRCPWFLPALWTQRGPDSGPSGRGHLRRSGPPRPGPDRPAADGRADHSVPGMAPVQRWRRCFVPWRSSRAEAVGRGCCWIGA
jgi:hypothetical protein